ncbi:MAG: hypothetical protein ACFFD9_04575 [Candidatus Thorarchaeota archaeon]
MEVDLTTDNSLALWVELPVEEYLAAPTIDVVPFPVLFIGLFFGQRIMRFLFERQHQHIIRLVNFVNNN